MINLLIINLIDWKESTRIMEFITNCSECLIFNNVKECVHFYDQLKINPTANKAQILLDSLRQEISVYDQGVIEAS